MDHDKRDATMDGIVRGWNRITAVAGLLTVLLVVIGVATYANVHVNDSISTIRQAFMAGRTQALVSIDCQLLSVITFLIFLAGVWRVLSRAEGNLGVLALVWVAGSIALALITIVWQAAYGAAVLAAPYAGPGELKVLVALSNTLDQVSPVPIAVLMGAASVVTVQTRILPRWTGWLGAVITVVSVVAALDIVHVNSTVGIANPIALSLWLVWMAAVSVSLLRQQEDRKTRTATRPVGSVSN